jgi:hypothetical protein
MPCSNIGVKVQKLIVGKVSSNRAENIFPKYLLDYLHKIAVKYPREKKYSSVF